MQFENIIYEKKEGIARITKNKPGYVFQGRSAPNGMTQGMMMDVKAAVEEAARDSEVRVIIIDAAGEGFHSGAVTLQNVTEGGTPLILREVVHIGHEVYNMIENLEKPVIYKVKGGASGGGCEMGHACDFVIAAETATFSQGEVNGGIIPGWGGTQRVPRLAGLRKGMEMILTGDPIDGKEAERVGLITKAVPAEKVEEETWALAKKLAAKPPVALAMAKSAIRKGMQVDLRTGLAYEAEVEALCMTTEQLKEARVARTEGRTPVFKPERRVTPGQEWK